MGTLLVTVVGAGQEDVALPDDEPIRALVPRLIQLCGIPRGPEEATRWTLALPGEAPLPDSASLGALGVLEGATLYLRSADDAGQAQPGPNGSPRPAAAAVEPARILPSPPGTAKRLRSAAKALLGGPAMSTRGSPGDDRVTRRRPPREAAMSPLERARLSWHSGDYEQQLSHLVTVPRLRRGVTVAVTSPRPSVGATTFTFLTGTLMAQLRWDSVLSVDANPHDGSLGGLLPPDRQLSLEHLVAVPAGPTAHERFVPRFAPGTHELGVLSLTGRHQEDACLQGFHQARDVADVLLIDCPPGGHAPAQRAALEVADHLVMVTDADPTTMDLAAQVTAATARPGMPVLLVVNKMPPDPERVDLRSLAAAVPDALVVVVPDEPGGSALVGPSFDWATAPPTWSLSMRENLVVLLAQWKAAGLAD